MKRSKPKARYQGFALSVSLIQEIKNQIKDDPAYRSVTDYVRQAVREKMAIDKSISPPSPFKKEDIMLVKRTNPIVREFEEIHKKIETISKNIVTREDLKEFTDLLIHDRDFAVKKKKKKNDNSNGVGL